MNFLIIIADVINAPFMLVILQNGDKEDESQGSTFGYN